VIADAREPKKRLQTKRHCGGMIRTPPGGCESFIAVTKTELQTLNYLKAYSQFSNVRNPVIMTPTPITVQNKVALNTNKKLESERKFWREMFFSEFV